MSTAALELLISLKDEASAGLSAIGGGLTSMAGLAAAGGLALTGAVVGVGAAAFDMASDVNQAANDMQAALGLTADEAQNMAQVAADVWANNWGDSIDDVSASLTTVAQNMGAVGVTSNEALSQATAAALALRDSFGTDVAESTDAATTLMQQFGLSSQQAFDFIASGMQQGLNRSGDFLDTIGEYSTQFAAGGATADGFFSLLQSGLQGGVLGTDKAADAFKEFRVRIQDGSTATSAGLQQLGIDSQALAQQMASGQITAADAFQLVLGKLNETGDANVRMQAGVALLGTQFEDLGTNGALALSMTGTSMADLAGATDSLNAKYQNWGSLWEGFKRQALDALQPAATAALQIANEAMPAVLSVLPPVVALFTMLAGVMSDWAQSFSEGGLGGLLNNIIFSLTGITGAGFPVIDFFQQLIGAAQPLVDLIGANLMPILAAIGTVVGGVLLSGLVAAAGAFIALVAPIAALVAGLALLYAAFNSNFLGIQMIVTTALGAVVSIVSTVGSQIAAVWQANGATIMAAAQAAWGALLGLVSGVLSGVLGVVSAVGGQIAAFWQANGASIMATVQATWAQLGTIISGAIQIAIAIITTLSGVVTTVFGGIAAFVQANTASIQAALTGAWQVIQGVITTAMGVISGVIRTVLAAIQGDWSGVWAGLSQIVSSAISGIGSVLAGLGNIVRGALGLLGGVIGEAAAAAGRAALGLGKSIVDGIMSGLSAAAGRLTKAVSDLAKGALDAAKSALGIKSPSREFAQQVGAPSALGIAAGFTQAMPKVTANLVSGVAGLMEKVASAVENGSKALAAVSGFQGAGGSGLSGFLAGIKDLAIQFNDAATVLGGRILGTATRFADTIGKVTAPIDGALKALGGLVDFVAPARANISAFIASMFILLNALNNMAVMFEAKAIKAAAVFAEGAAKMLAVVGPAIEALKKLPDLVSPTWVQVNAFGEALYKIVTELLNVAALFESRSLQAGAAFGEAGAKLLAVVGPAIEALKKLPELIAPTDAAIWLFADALRRVVTQLIAVAALFAQDAIDAAAKFAEGAGKTIAIVGSGVDGFTKLADFAGVPQAAIDAFGVALAATLVRLIAVAQTFTAEAIAAAAVFGEGAGKALAMIGATVDGFVKLADFAGVGDAAIAAFGTAITATVARLVQVAAGFEQSTIDAAATFGAGVGKALSGIGAAVDSLGKLIDFKAPAEKAIQAFFLAIGGIMERMDSWSTFYNERMFASTAALSEGIKGAVANLGGIADSLGKLVDFQAPADASVKAFFLAIGGIMERLDSWSVTINTRMIETATAFTGGIAVVITQLRNALEAFATLGDAKNLGSSVLTAFMGSLTTLVNQMAAYLPPNAEVIGANTIVGLINGIYSQRSNLIAAMTNTVLAAVQAAQATLGIASPSKVFERIGQYTGQGMAGGMSAMQPAVASAGAGLGMAAVGGAAGSAGGSRAGGGSAGTINITFAANAISVNGVQGGLNDKHLKKLSGYIKEDIAADIGKR